MLDVEGEIKRVIAAKMGPKSAPLNGSDSLDDLGLSSFDVVEMIFDIEETFDIQIPYNANSDIEAKTIADLVRTVQNLVAAKAKLA